MAHHPLLCAHPRPQRCISMRATRCSPFLPAPRPAVHASSSRRSPATIVATASPWGTRPTVLLTRRIPSSAVATLEAECDVDRNDGDPLSPDQLRARLADKEGVVCLMTDVITPEVMDAAPRLKVIANVAVGFNNIDVPAARARNIVVTNTPEVLTDATADLA